MLRAVDRLSGFVERRRLLVVAVWLAALIAAIPFSLRQTDHLTSGGFVVPGSGSARADSGLRAFPGAQRDRLAAVLEVGPGAGQAGLRAALDRLRGAVSHVSHVSLPSTSGGTP